MNKYICILISILCPFYNVSAQEIAQKYCETDGIVNSTLKLNNKIYIGGNFSYVGKTTGAFGAYEIANPNNILLPIAIDGNIQTIAKDASGK
ncbi:MAG: hypothetical protein KA981_08750, partial [Bacteroidia bacterium]|nr:hypothetical protein [Bacteroidia bacterium]